MTTSLPELDVAPPPATGPEQEFVARVRFGSIDGEDVAALVDPARFGRALVVEAASLESALDSAGVMPDAHEFHAPDGAARSLFEVDEFSFLSGFRYESAPGALIADPQVGVCQVGSRLVVHPRWGDTGGRWQLDVQANVIDATSDLESEGEIFPGTEDIRFQVPVYSATTARTSAELAPGEALLLLAPQPMQDGEWLVAIVEPLVGAR